MIAIAEVYRLNYTAKVECEGGRILQDNMVASDDRRERGGGGFAANSASQARAKAPACGGGCGLCDVSELADIEQHIRRILECR